jgi:alpha-ribazole phosphatase
MALHLTRHAPTAAPQKQVVGHRDAPLSEEGRAAAADFANACAARLDGPPARLVSSDLRRARDTAAALAARWDRTVETDARLRELHFGAWEGRTWAEVERDDAEALSDWMTDWVHAAPPGGESFAALADRVEAWLGDQRFGEATQRPVFVVAHAGVLRALLCRTLGLPLSAAFGFAFDPLRLSVLRRAEENRWTAASLNAPVS